MNKVNSALLPLALIFTVASCAQLSSKKNFTNREHYEILAGGQFEIYYTTNSCCQYCVLNGSELTVVKLVDDKVVKDYPKDCYGCDRASAFVFEAIAAGTDTIYLNSREASASCYELAGEPEKYVVTVKAK